MLTLTSNKQAEKLIKDGVLKVDDDIEIAFDGFKIDADIKCKNIYSKEYGRDIDARNIDARNIDALNIDARNIDAGDINAWNINAWNINARNIDARNIDALNIDAWNINARNIDARNINAGDINAWNINARNIDAWNINARNIDYHAICIAYISFKCISVKGRRENSIHKCLDGEIEFKKAEEDKTNDKTEEAMKLLKEKGYRDDILKTLKKEGE